MTRRSRFSAALLALALLGAACGGSDGTDDKGADSTPSTAPADGTTSSTPGSGAGSTDGGSSASVDAALLGRVAAATRDLFKGVDLPDARFAELADHLCAAVTSGSATGATAAATAQAIVDAIAPSPADTRFRPAMVLAAQFYLTEGDCGGPVAYARSVREALLPLQNAAMQEVR